MKKLYLLFLILFALVSGNAQSCTLTVLSTVNATAGQCDGSAVILQTNCGTSGCTYSIIAGSVMHFSGDTIFIDSLCVGNFSFNEVCGNGTIYFCQIYILTVGINKVALAYPDFFLSP